MEKPNVLSFDIQLLEQREHQQSLKLTLHGGPALELLLSLHEGRSLAVELIDAVHRADVKSSLRKQARLKACGGRNSATVGKGVAEREAPPHGVPPAAGDAVIV